jgi:hypothetical protein
MDKVERFGMVSWYIGLATWLIGLLCMSGVTLVDTYYPILSLQLGLHPSLVDVIVLAGFGGAGIMILGHALRLHSKRNNKEI